mmetsp:Transcript_27872/g.48365  ORF Transcript_27872/g.48365 Transcript_27872/m.48365 type:complete len:227 (-) Transcript_27872:645-1325(-)
MVMTIFINYAGTAHLLHFSGEERWRVIRLFFLCYVFCCCYFYFFPHFIRFVVVVLFGHFAWVFILITALLLLKTNLEQSFIQCREMFLQQRGLERRPPPAAAAAAAAPGPVEEGPQLPRQRADRGHRRAQRRGRQRQAPAVQSQAPPPRQQPGEPGPELLVEPGVAVDGVLQDGVGQAIEVLADLVPAPGLRLGKHQPDTGVCATCHKVEIRSCFSKNFLFIFDWS